MSPESVRIRRSPTAAWREIDGQVAIVSTDVNRVRLLNAVGSFVWIRCEDKTVDDLVSSVASQYGIARERAEEDVRAFVDDLQARGMIEFEAAK
jgi:hypothetical protein